MNFRITDESSRLLRCARVALAGLAIAALDLGLVGLVLTLALLVAWMAAAGRATHPFNRRWTSWKTLRAFESSSRSTAT